MAIYEFYCDDCHDRFEEMRPMTQAHEDAACPLCGGAHTRRIISLSNVFSGDGKRRRAVAGTSPCSGCMPSPTACAACGFK